MVAVFAKPVSERGGKPAHLLVPMVLSGVESESESECRKEEKPTSFGWRQESCHHASNGESTCGLKFSFVSLSRVITIDKCTHPSEPTAAAKSCLMRSSNSIRISSCD